MDRYVIPACEVRTETLVVNSRFITTAAPATSVEQAKVFIKRMRIEFDDASHNVPLYVVGHGSSVIAHCSDAGEPFGTAGRPALSVLQGSGIGDTAIVVTRYFGGTKLGTGGLVRAYSEAVRKVLRALPLAEKVPTITVMIAVPYHWFDRVRLWIAEQYGEILDEDFAAEVTVTAKFAEEHFSVFQAKLTERTAGRLHTEVVETNQGEIMPVGAMGGEKLNL
ncbi:MAG: IMPACT family protein [Anaerolineae bacterium]|nr:IMPACT family protein [Anaerolineae bacterium]